MYELDLTVTRIINGFAGASGALDALMIWVSAVGVPILIAGAALQWWRRDDRPHVKHILVATGLSFALGLGFNQIVLLFIQRARPYANGVTHLLVAKSSDPSFPSDHATATIAIATAFLLHGMQRTGLAFLAAAIVVMFSRVYIGTHYVSDVLGGASTGLAAALAVLVLYREGTRLDRTITAIL